MTKPPRRMSMSPQEKKAASYAHDRRNGYGESPHGARKNIPRSKARAKRLLRHADKVALRDIDAAIEVVPLRRRKPKWKKWADVSLRTHLRRRRHREALVKAQSRGVPPLEWPRWPG